VQQPVGPTIPYANPPPECQAPGEPALPPCDHNASSEAMEPAHTAPLPPTPAARPTSTGRSQTSRHVKLPEYDGTAEVGNFFVRFEIACKALGEEDDDMKKACLLGKLKGAALAWSQTLKDELITMTYVDMRKGLTKHFQGEASGAARRLLDLTQAD
jgi:hypothetical protein